MLRIILVDDEHIVLKGMTHVLSRLPGLCEIVGVADGGAKALQMIEGLKPDVVITDVKMPDIDGIELTRLVMKKYPHTYMVVLSGHAEFEYARNALRYGAYDYLLKPCKFKYISRCLHQIESEIKEKKKDKIDSGQHNYRQKLLYYLVNKVEGYTPELNIPEVCVISMIYNNRITQDDVISKLLEDEFLQKITPETLLEYMKYNNRLIIIIHNHDHMHYIKELLYRMKLRLNRCGSWICGGISKAYVGLGGLKEAYEESISLAENLLFNDIYEIHDHTVTITWSCHVEPFDDTEIIKYVLKGDKNILETRVKSLIESLEKSGPYVPKVFKTRIKELMIMLQKELSSKHISLDSIFNRPIDSMYEIEKMDSRQQLLNWIKNMLISICQYVNQNKSQLPKAIQQAISFIHENYHRDVSMKLIADKVYLNHWYFSELFKDTVGITFSDYMTNLRIDQAKKLLAETSLKNYEISEMVGFNNATYFNAVFKKVEGVTPKKYRNLIS